jgi:hypothetical protein
MSAKSLAWADAHAYFLTTKGTKKHEHFLEFGGVLIVTSRNSIANFRLFSPTDLTDLLDPSDPTDLLSVFRPCSVRV